MWIKENIIWLPVSFIVMLCITVGLYFALRNKSARIKRIPFIVIAAIIVILEIAKQTVLVVNLDYYNYRNFLPFYICSLFLLTLPLAAFGKIGTRFNNVFWALSLLLGVLMMVGLYAAPNMIIGPSTPINNGFCIKTTNHHGLHKFYFHHLIVLWVMLSVALKPYRPNIKDFLFGATIFGAWLILIAGMTVVFDIDYAMFLLKGLSLPFLEQMRALHPILSTGFIWFIYIIGYLIITGAILGTTRLANGSLKRKNIK